MLEPEEVLLRAPTEQELTRLAHEVKFGKFSLTWVVKDGQIVEKQEEKIQVFRAA